MKRSALPPLLYAAANAALWVGVLPAVLLADADAPLSEAWRPVPLMAVAALVALAGAVLIFLPSLALYRHGVPLYGVTPGPVLVTDGWYGRIRNPQHVGTVVLALAPAAAVDEGWLWAIPAAVAAWLAAGLEPLEDRRLLEEFDDDFRDYRAAVPRWVPKVRG